jgi:muramoyltetrapeptide carboxypeptidase
MGRLFFSMISPKSLQPGDKIGIVATGRKVTEEHVEPAVREFKKWGMQVVLSPRLYSSGHSYLAGTDEDRLAGLQQFLDDPEIATIVCARGGYGTTRIIDSVDFSGFKKHPKWVVGFSDVTALHLRISSLGFESIHGTMPILFSKKDSASSIEQLRRVLFGDPVELTAAPCENNRHGIASGKLIGGNLSLLVDGLGTSHQPETQGKILVLEEVDEYLYKIDRMMVQLKRAGKLGQLAGLVVGHFTEIKDTELSFGESVEEIIRFHTKEFSYPVAFGFPTGHENPNFAWIEGRDAHMTVTAHGAIIKHSRLPDQFKELDAGV